MSTRQRRGGQANALRGRLVLGFEEPSRAPAESVYDLLADVGSHLEWGGRMQRRKNYRLLSIDAPQGPASVGSEFRSTGADAMGTFADSSVVTEASRPSLFEFVTEARLTTKKGKVIEWTLVHRYRLSPLAEGCAIAYAIEVARISELVGPMALFNVPGLRAIAEKVSGSFARRGLRNLARLAEERAGL